MRASRGEIKIQEILQEAGLRFTMEQSFEGLNSTNGRALRFDFCVFDDDGNIDFLSNAQAFLSKNNVAYFIRIDNSRRDPQARTEEQSKMLSRLQEERCPREPRVSANARFQQSGKTKLREELPPQVPNNKTSAKDSSRRCGYQADKLQLSDL